MVTAIDSSVLLLIGKGEPGGFNWIDLLNAQAQLGRLVVCDIVVAETAAFFRHAPDVVGFLQNLQISYEPLLPDSAVLAGSMFRAYRAAGGPREHLIPDFLIGAHAQVQASQLAALDRGFLRRYFPKLKVIAPK